MLPRCARAIETGYSILTSRLWCGTRTYLGDDRVRRNMGHADNAFSLRVLPSYAKCLKEKLESESERVKNILSGRRFSTINTLLWSQTALADFQLLVVAQQLQCPPVELELPSHEWLGDRDFDELMDRILETDQVLFGYLQDAICFKLRIPVQRFGCMFKRNFQSSLMFLRYSDTFWLNDLSTRLIWICLISAWDCIEKAVFR